MGERFATIDIGSNSVLLLVAERAADGGFARVDERLEITRLGKGVDRTRRLDPAALDATLAAVARFASIAREAGARAIAASATSAARDAENGALLFERARREAGVEVEVISGEREARLSWETARRDFGAGGRPLAVLDIGGGSTEVILGAGPAISFARSHDVGSVRLAERHLRSDPPAPSELAALRADLAAAFAAVPPPPEGVRAVGIAGTVTTLCTIELGMDTYDGSVVHGRALATSTVRSLASRLAALPLAQRLRLPGLPEKRADAIVAGAEILTHLLERLGVPEVTVSDRGVRWGLLYEKFG